MAQTLTKPKSKLSVDQLKPFCASDDSHYAMSKPFVVKGWRYATDGRICVRVPADGNPDSKEMVPPVADLQWPDRLTNPKPWPEADYVVAPQRSGADDWSWSPSLRTQTVGRRVLRAHYHYLIGQLPGVRFSADGEPNRVLLFKFRGGEGMVMPVPKEKL